MIGFLKILQIVIALLLIVLVLIQSKETGLNKYVGNAFSFYSAKRGVEKFIFILTNVLVFLFAINSLLILYFS